LRHPDQREVAIGRFLRGIFGGKSSVHRYADDNGQNDLFLVTAHGSPIDGVTSFGTVGLSAHPMRFHDRNVRVEILGACASTGFIEV